MNAAARVCSLVAPLAGAWIETQGDKYDDNSARSRPSRARGLKQALVMRPEQMMQVAPLAGAWIETSTAKSPLYLNKVAPLAGAWIETSIMRRTHPQIWRSRPSRARGLKPQEGCS